MRGEKQIMKEGKRKDCYHLECYVGLSDGNAGFRTKLLASIIRNGGYFENLNRKINRPKPTKKVRSEVLNSSSEDLGLLGCDLIYLYFGRCR